MKGNKTKNKTIKEEEKTGENEKKQTNVREIKTEK